MQPAAVQPAPPSARPGTAAWLIAQLAELERWMSGNPHRWPTRRVVVAIREIRSGNDGWRLRAADALQEEP